MDRVTSSTVMDSIPITTIDERKTIEEQITRTQRQYRDETSSNRSIEHFRNITSVSARRPRVSSRASSSRNSTLDAVDSSRYSSTQSMRHGSNRPNQSLSDRLERLLLYYNGNNISVSSGHSDSYSQHDEDNDLIMSLSDIASASSMSTTNDTTRVRSLSRSSISSHPSLVDEVNDLFTSTIPHHVGGMDGIQSLEELEDLMLFEVRSLKLIVSWF